MAKIISHPDVHYQRHPLEMLRYDDAIFRSLVSSVPNYYYGGGWDSTLYGTALRGVSSEQARLEFGYHYDMIARNPLGLTPADIRRRLADLLYVNKNYPGTTQFDTEYKQMLLDLRNAYRKGATVGAIGDVIRAYTGQTFYIEELFKLIGTPTIDESDRNALKISVHAGAESLRYTEQTRAQLVNETERIKALTDDLYHAIDLAKPAHVGINLTTIFGLDENIGAFVSPKDAHGVGISDDLRIFVLLEEGEPGDPMFHFLRQSPLTPDTGLHSIYKTPFAVHYQWFREYLGNIYPITGATDPFLRLHYKEIPATPQDFNMSWDGARFFCIASLKDAEGTQMKKDGIDIKTRTAAAQLRIKPYLAPDVVNPAPATPPPPGSTHTNLVVRYHPSSVLVQQPNPMLPSDTTVTFQGTAEHTLPVPGVLHPKLNRVWEIQSDEFVGSDLE